MIDRLQYDKLVHFLEKVELTELPGWKIVCPNFSTLTFKDLDKNIDFFFMINTTKEYGAAFENNPATCHQLSYCFKQIEALKIFSEEFKIRNFVSVTFGVVKEEYKKKFVTYKVFVLDSIKESLRVLAGGEK